MSLEQALNENTAALIAHTAALKENTASRDAAIKSAETLKTTAAKPKAEVEDEPKAPAKKAEPKAETKPKADPKPAKKKAATLDSLKSAVGAYLAGPEEWNEVGEDEAEEMRNERTDFVVAMLAEVGAAKVSEIDKGDWERCLDYIERKDAGEEVDFGEDEPKKKKSASLID